MDTGDAKMCQIKFSTKSLFCISSSERPRGEEPFDVLWAKFDFDDGFEDDEVMWDIRYLLMGSKMEKLPGFPIQLADIREKLFVTRDGFSERVRRVRQD